jgi:hypothetical protein
MGPFDIVKDSSIWQNGHAYDAVNRKDPFLRIGIVKKVYRDKKGIDLRYLVEIQDRSDTIEVNAKLLRRHGGVFNYEDTILHGYKIDDKPDSVRSFNTKAGDTVLVGFLNGEAREAIILGCLTHPARETTIDIEKGPQYASEFNGIETKINENGEYKLTFKGIPKNIKKLDEKPASKLPKPEYDEKIGGSYWTFDKTGSFEVNDKSTENGFQNFKIDKAKGTIEINSGKIKLLITKKEEKVTLACKILDITSTDKISGKTKDFKMDASATIKLKSPKIAIGKEGNELLQQIFKLVEALGMVKPISPLGPCTPLMATPEWPDVKQIQSKIKEITGTF